MPSEAADQAGAVRDLVAAMKRSPTLGDAHRGPGAPRVDPGAGRRAAAAGLHASPARGRRSIGLAGLLLLGRRAEAQRPDGRRSARSRPAIRRRAAAEFLKEAGAGTRQATPRSTTRAPRRCEAGRLEVARGALAEAAKSLDPGLRYRALYNLGPGRTARRPGRHVAGGGAAGRGRRPAPPGAAAGAVVGSRQVEPGAGRAPPPTAAAAERGRRRAAAAERRTAGAAAASRSQPEPRDLSQSQAEQILNSMERRERLTREEQQRRMQSGSAGGVKDW